MDFSRDGISARLRAERDGRGAPSTMRFAGAASRRNSPRARGADLVTTFNLAYYRMQGLSSMAGYLPIGDANAITLELGERSILNVVRECPVIAGLLGADPTRDMSGFVDKIAAAGFHGVMNCPTVALIDGNFRKDLEETGMGFFERSRRPRLCEPKGHVHQSVHDDAG